jgi:hypothetical protein
MPSPQYISGNQCYTEDHEHGAGIKSHRPQMQRARRRSNE